MTALAIPQPQAVGVVDLPSLCERANVWVEQAQDVAEVKDNLNRFAAIDRYMELTGADQRKPVQTTMRRFEMRIGDLLGPTPDPRETGARKGSGTTEPLDKDQRHEFRQMAANADVVDEVINESTDKDPPSRRKVMKAIKQRATPQRSPLALDAERVGWQFRKAVERLERIAEDDRFSTNKEQVAAHLNGHLSYAIEVCQDLFNQLTGEH